jgi:outer membrane protein assembly factor BamD (BamD/ComL family)
MNCTKLTLVAFLIILLTSCAVTRRYERAIEVNTVDIYEEYLQDFPNSKYKSEVEQKLNTLLDEEAWRVAFGNNTIESYENYITKFPAGIYLSIAMEYIKKLEYEQEIDTAWKKAENENSLLAYKSFLELYPNSSQAFLAKLRIGDLEEKSFWSEALLKNKVESYSSYLVKYPSGDYAEQARMKIKQLEDESIRPIWNAVLKKNTIQAYRDFYNNYSRSAFASEALNKISELEEVEWNKALRKNTIGSFKDFIKKFPESIHIAEAEKRIIDLEVDQIFKGDHGELPPLSRNNYSTNSSPTSTIEIFNNTDYILTIRYSGSESVKLVFSPKQRRTTTLSNGSFRITATVNAPNVQDYAGEEFLIGGEYEATYYIVTERY